MKGLMFPVLFSVSQEKYKRLLVMSAIESMHKSPLALIEVIICIGNGLIKQRGH